MSEWQDISTAPKDGSDIILFIQDRQVIGRYYYNQLYGPVWSYDDGCSAELGVPTHWQPLPPPPTP